MALVHDGDARAFEVIFDRHAGPAFSLAYRMCGRRALAEEIVQEAFMSLWRSAARYDRTRGQRPVVGAEGRAQPRGRHLPARAVDRPPRRGRRLDQRGSSRARADRGRGRAPQRRPARAHRARRAAPGSASGGRARVLRRLLARTDRRDARAAGRDRQGPHAARAQQAADRARRAGGGAADERPDPTAWRSDCGNDAAPYVLGALEPAEARAFARHMQSCAVCRDEVAALVPVLDVCRRALRTTRSARRCGDG